MPMKIKIKRGRTTLQLSESQTSISDHHSSPLSSASTIAANDDLLTEILLRLPIPSLLRSKSVSKHWLSLITDPQFSLLRNPNPNHVSGLLLHRPSCLDNPEFDFLPLDGDDHNSPNPPFRTLNFVNDPSGIRIFDSCNGLLCCSSSRCSEYERKYFICNPTTKQFIKLPRIGGGDLRIIYGVYLAFDPLKSPNYKVVCVRNSELVHHHYQIEIYCSDEGHWRVSGKPFTSKNHAQFKRGVYWNGAIHWFSSLENSLYFGVHQERLETMPVVLNLEDRANRRFPYFGESLDHLHLVEMTMTQFTVYEMERDHSKRSVKYRVDLKALIVVFPEIIRGLYLPSNMNDYAIALLLIVRREKDEDTFLVLHVPGKALRYHFVDKTIEKICDFHPGDHPNIDFLALEGCLNFSGCSDAFPYIESLFCV